MGTENAQYEISFIPQLDIPAEGVMTITIPTGISAPSANNLSVKCNNGCRSNGSLTYSFGSGELTLKNMFAGGYNVARTAVKFTITGFKNAPDTAPRTFSLMIGYDGGGITPINIEKIDKMSISATEGLCQVQEVFVTDGDTRIYAQPANYTFKLFCSHAIKSTFGMTIVFPSDFILVDRASCLFGGYNTRYYC